MKPRFLLVDGYALAYRAFFAYPEHLTAPDGSPVNAILGFFTLMFQAIEKLQPTYFCICLDHKGKTFRHETYPEYKANRESPPDNFIAQLQRLRPLLEQCGFPFFEKEGYEADDFLGSLVSQPWANEVHSYILSGDMDIFQLVSDLSLIHI